MSIAQKHQVVTVQFRGLPDTKDVASYNFVDQAVILRTLTLKNIEQVRNAKNFEERWPLHLDIWLSSHHEYRHWADMSTSVFGLKWLCQVVSVIPKSLAQLANPGEEFKEACRKATKQMATIHLPEYYSTVENDIPPPWRYTSTVGRAFDTDGEINPQHPLWFVRFFSTDNLNIARQPISVASLLEIRAVKTEMQFGSALISQLPNEGMKRVERAFFTQSMMKRLYTPELTVYSVAAHWYANRHSLTDFAEAGIAASHLAWFCLDAPTKWLRGLTSTAAFEKLHDKLSGEVMTISLRRGDRGALYYLLAADERIGSKTTLIDLDRFLREEWNITLSEVRSKAWEEKQAILAKLRNSPATAGLSKIWGHNLNLMRTGDELEIASGKSKFPAVILADDTVLNVRTMKLNDAAFDKSIFDPRPYFDEFMNASIALSKFGTYSDKGLQCFSDR